MMVRAALTPTLSHSLRSREREFKWIACATLLLLCSCAGISQSYRDAVATGHATYDFNCPENKIKVVTVLEASRYDATGCGKRATYLMHEDGTFALNEPVKPIEEKK
jgi:hypothetical protein